MTLLTARRLYIASRGQVPNRRVTSVEPIEVNRITFMYFKFEHMVKLCIFFFCIEVTLTVSIYLCFQFPLFTEGTVGWAGIPHFRVAYWEATSCLKVFLFIAYFLGCILVCSDTELRLNSSSVSSGHWQRLEKARASSPIRTANIWTSADRLGPGVSLAFCYLLHLVSSRVGHFSFLPLFLLKQEQFQEQEVVSV